MEYYFHFLASDSTFPFSIEHFYPRLLPTRILRTVVLGNVSKKLS